jgi:hypothetical protein
VASGFFDAKIDPDRNSMPRRSWPEFLLGVTPTIATGGNVDMMAEEQRLIFFDGP